MNRAQLIIFGTIGVIILFAILVIYGVIPGIRRQPPEPVTITVWGFESEDLWEEFAARYHEKLRHITVLYTRKDPRTFENELLNALAAGGGPDIFSLRNAHIQKHLDKLFLLPQDGLHFRARDFRNTFFNAAANDLVTKDGDILGAPLAVDTLALFYNRDFLNSANIPLPPKTWEEVTDTAKRLTVFSEVGTVTRSGVALGTSANVEHAVDILALLMAQQGVELIDRQTLESRLEDKKTSFEEGPAESALTFYTSFADSRKRSLSWSVFFPSSLDAFSTGKTAMTIGYASDVPAVVEKNPHLNFDVAPFPQPTDTPNKAYYARYQFEAVSKQSKHPIEAWKFLLWLADRENVKTFADAVGLAPARRDLVNEKPPREYLEIFYSQVLPAKTWLIPDEDEIKSIFVEMIDSVVNRAASPETAVSRAHIRLNNLLERSPL